MEGHGKRRLGSEPSAGKEVEKERRVGWLVEVNGMGHSWGRVLGW